MAIPEFSPIRVSSDFTRIPSGGETQTRIRKELVTHFGSILQNSSASDQFYKASDTYEFYDEKLAFSKPPAQLTATEKENRTRYRSLLTREITSLENLYQKNLNSLIEIYKLIQNDINVDSVIAPESWGYRGGHASESTANDYGMRETLNRHPIQGVPGKNLRERILNHLKIVSSDPRYKNRWDEHFSDFYSKYGPGFYNRSFDELISRTSGWPEEKKLILVLYIIAIYKTQSLLSDINFKRGILNRIQNKPDPLLERFVNMRSGVNRYLKELANRIDSSAWEHIQRVVNPVNDGDTAFREGRFDDAERFYREALSKSQDRSLPIDGYTREDIEQRLKLVEIGKNLNSYQQNTVLPEYNRLKSLKPEWDSDDPNREEMQRKLRDLTDGSEIVTNFRNSITRRNGRFDWDKADDAQNKMRALGKELNDLDEYTRNLNESAATRRSQAQRREIEKSEQDIVERVNRKPEDDHSSSINSLIQKIRDSELPDKDARIDRLNRIKNANQKARDAKASMERGRFKDAGRLYEEAQRLLPDGFQNAQTELGKKKSKADEGRQIRSQIQPQYESSPNDSDFNSHDLGSGTINEQEKKLRSMPNWDQISSQWESQKKELARRYDLWRSSSPDESGTRRDEVMQQINVMRDFSQENSDSAKMYLEQAAKRYEQARIYQLKGDRDNAIRALVDGPESASVLLAEARKNDKDKRMDPQIKTLQTSIDELAAQLYFPDLDSQVSLLISKMNNFRNSYSSMDDFRLLAETFVGLGEALSSNPEFRNKVIVEQTGLSGFDKKYLATMFDPSSREFPVSRSEFYEKIDLKVNRGETKIFGRFTAAQLRHLIRNNPKRPEIQKLNELFLELSRFLSDPALRKATLARNNSSYTPPNDPALAQRVIGSLTDIMQTYTGSSSSLVLRNYFNQNLLSGQPPEIQELFANIKDRDFSSPAQVVGVYLMALDPEVALDSSPEGVQALIDKDWRYHSQIRNHISKYLKNNGQTICSGDCTPKDLYRKQILILLDYFRQLQKNNPNPRRALQVRLLELLLRMEGFSEQGKSQRQGPDYRPN